MGLRHYIGTTFTLQLFLVSISGLPLDTGIHVQMHHGKNAIGKSRRSLSIVCDIVCDSSGSGCGCVPGSSLPIIVSSSAAALATTLETSTSNTETSQSSTTAGAPSSSSSLTTPTITGQSSTLASATGLPENSNTVTTAISSNTSTSSSTQSITNTAPLPTTSLSSTNGTVEDHHQKPNIISSIIGGILGGIVLVILIATCLICWRQRRLKSKVAFSLYPFQEPTRSVVPIPVLRMEKPQHLHNAINLERELSTGQIPSQKRRQQQFDPGVLPNSRMSHMAPAPPQVAEALEGEANHQQTQPLPSIFVDEQHGNVVEGVIEGTSDEHRLEDDTGQIQGGLNLITFQHQDSGLRVVELPPAYLSL